MKTLQQLEPLKYEKKLKIKWNGERERLRHTHTQRKKERGAVRF